MLRCSIGLTCVLWAACSFAQSSPTPIAAGSAAKVVCKSESEEVVLHATTSAALPIVDILPCAAEVTVVSKQTGWYRVRTQGGKEGWVKETFFSATSPVEQATSHIKDGYITCVPAGATGTDLMESPTSLRTVMMLHCGEKVALLEEGSRGNENWDKVETTGGSVGYVMRWLVSANPPTVQAEYDAPYAKPAPRVDADVNLAVRGITMMRDSVLDPTSFTMLQVLVSPKSGGCVHFVASNTFGGRVQQWGTYGLDKKGRLSVYLLASTVLYTQNIVDGCIKFSVRDVTAEVKKALSQGDGR